MDYIFDFFLIGIVICLCYNVYIIREYSLSNLWNMVNYCVKGNVWCRVEWSGYWNVINKKEEFCIKKRKIYFGVVWE